MGIPKRLAVAVSGLAFTGGTALALAAPAGAAAMVTAPDQAISGGNVLGGGGGGGGGGGRGPRPVIHRAVVVHKPAMRQHRVGCSSCSNRENFHDFERQSVRMHKRVIIVNRNHNFSDSETEQRQRQRQRQELEQEQPNMGAQE